ncbi:hypothetical protein CSB93_6970 (plasmid) [Pseudomonas paraeruginosa]|uniref:Uncharacterized protein n=1 Tax=Pseudomonas paraeruginosa TaxID=2994495 RepID=A0A2R3IKW4_9PSED|nr:hypothetical protein CSB93_6970 [Pseudomonas paraeruginosa]
MPSGSSKWRTHCPRAQQSEGIRTFPAISSPGVLARAARTRRVVQGPSGSQPIRLAIWWQSHSSPYITLGLPVSIMTLTATSQTLDLGLAIVGFLLREPDGNEHSPNAKSISQTQEGPVASRCLVVGLRPSLLLGCFLPAKFRPNLSQEHHVSSSFLYGLLGPLFETRPPKRPHPADLYLGLLIPGQAVKLAVAHLYGGNDHVIGQGRHFELPALFLHVLDDHAVLDCRVLVELDPQQSQLDLFTVEELRPVQPGAARKEALGHRMISYLILRCLAWNLIRRAASAGRS